ncbi:MAG: SUF system Fe-S cluster assembly regulator, partial [Proteobacteria bacterium]|nr:SUF system Fe-S cluster assembly regulator [Pseudomonadota bacterium]
MIKLSRMSDYAVVVLEALSRDEGNSLSATQIAAAANLPEPTAAKVLKLMASGGVVTS